MARKRRDDEPEMTNCYTASFHLTHDDATWTLVHGIVTGSGPIEGVRYGHAWVERDGMAHDPVAGVTAPALLYRAAGRASDIQQYTQAEARFLALKHKHYGPWCPVIAAAAHLPDDDTEATKR